MVLLTGIRKNTVRMEEELALDTACRSALAEYHQELLKQYDLFFIDTSYGSSYPGVEAVGEHIKDYADKNLQNTNLISAHVSMLGMQEAAAAADDGGMVLEQQIMEYMEHYFGIEEIERIVSEFEPILSGQTVEEKSLLRQRDENEVRLSSQPPPVKKVKKSKYNAETGEMEEYEEEEEGPIENPAAYVNSLRNSGILNLVVKDTGALSQKSVFLEEYISRRSDMMQGTGLLTETKQDVSLLSDIKRRVLLQEYIFQKFGFYGEEKENGALAYQAEYLIGKKGSDVDNLKAVVHKLLLFREAANALYLFQDAQKRAEITAMASGVSAVALAPYLQPMLEISILFAWAYVESLQDVKILLENGKIPIVKTAADWRTGLNSILNPENALVTEDVARGMNYKQYLGMFLYMEDRQELLLLMMDVMEMDIRKTDYNENFRMDGCISGFKTAVKFESYDGDVCSFERTYQY